MKKIKYFFLLLFLLPLSCIKDDTVNVFNELNDIVIQDFQKRYDIPLGTALKIEPKISTRFDDEKELEYLWYRYDMTNYIMDTLSFERDLNVIIDDVAPGTWTLVIFKVIDTKTGVYARKETSVYTTGVYTNGTIMLCKTDNTYDLTFMKSGTGDLYEDLYSGKNQGEKLGAESKKIFVINPNTFNIIASKAVIVTANDPTGGVYLNPTTLVRQEYMHNKFIFPDDFSGDISVEGYANQYYSDYLIVNGKLHPRPNELYSVTSNWEPEILITTDPVDYSISAALGQPETAPFYSNPLVYDNKYGRFMYLKGSSTFSHFVPTSVSGSAFNPSNMGNLDMIISGCSNGLSVDLWALMRNRDTGEYVIITYAFTVGEILFNSKTKTVLSRADYPNLYAGSQFTPGTSRYFTSQSPWKNLVKGISGIFFFVNHDKVFAFNISTLVEAKIIDVAEENCSITAIACEELPDPTNLGSNASIIRLGVAVKSTTLTTKPAGLQFYKLEAVGGLSANKYYSKMGIADEIINFAEKPD